MLDDELAHDDAADLELLDLELLELQLVDLELVDLDLVEGAAPEQEPPDAKPRHDAGGNADRRGRRAADRFPADGRASHAAKATAFSSGAPLGCYLESTEGVALR